MTNGEQSSRRQRAVVTGASGFIGRHLCQALSDSGVEVHAVSRRPSVAPLANVQHWTSDWSQPTAPSELLQQIKPDVVYHFAGLVTGDRKSQEILPTLLANLIPAIHLFLAASDLGVRVVLAGTMEEPTEEARGAIASSPYAASKASASIYARMFASLYNLDVRILRLFMVYGPGPQEFRRFVPYVIQSYLRGQRPQLTRGERRMDWIYVRDVVEAAMLAATTEGLRGQTLDVGSGATTTAREMAETIKNLLHTDLTPDYGAVATRPLETEYCADTEATGKLLGWTPRFSLTDGLRQTIDWFRTQLSREGGESPKTSQFPMVGENS